MVVHLLGNIYHRYYLEDISQYLPYRQETIKHEKYKTIKKKNFKNINTQKITKLQWLQY